jgi:hypothetical protein
MSLLGVASPLASAAFGQRLVWRVWLGVLLGNVALYLAFRLLVESCEACNCGGVSCL